MNSQRPGRLRTSFMHDSDRLHDAALVVAAKREARLRGMAARAEGQPLAGLRLAGHLLAALTLPPRATVAGYWPLKDEIDPRPLMLALAGRGHGLALPVAGRRGTTLAFRSFRFGDALQPGPLGTAHPYAAAGEASPTVLLVPLVAFDAAGGRIGHGAGYYDRTLSELRETGPVLAIGIGYAAQRQPRVPTGPYDAALDLVATEAGVIIPE